MLKGAQPGGPEIFPGARPQHSGLSFSRMPLCQWGGSARRGQPDGDELQPLAAAGGLRVLLHWAGPGGGQPWVTFSEASITAEEVCLRVAQQVGECRASWGSWGQAGLHGEGGLSGLATPTQLGDLTQSPEGSLCLRKHRTCGAAAGPTVERGRN